MESVAVWLICDEGKQKGKVLLQKRAQKDIVNGEVKVQSSPGICQAACNGKVDFGESPMEAVKREIEEELGKAFADSFHFSSLVRFYTGSYTFNGEAAVGYNFYSFINLQQQNLIKLHAGAEPHFIAVLDSDFAKIKINGDKNADPETGIVLFRDQYKALKILLEILMNTTL